MFCQIRKAAAVIIVTVALASCSNPFKMNNLTSAEKKVIKKTSVSDFISSALSAEENGFLISAARKYAADSQPEYSENLLNCVNMEKLTFPEDRMSYYYTRGIISASKNSPGEAIENIKRAVDECSGTISAQGASVETVNFARLFLADLYSFLSSTYRSMGKFKEALEYNRSASKVYSSFPGYDLSKQLLMSFIMSAELSVKLNDFSGAEKSLDDAKNIFEEKGDMLQEKELSLFYTSYLVARYDYMAASGKYSSSEMDDFFIYALDKAEDAGSDKSISRIWLIKAFLAEESGNNELAFESLIKGVDYAKRSGDAVLQAVAEQRTAFMIDKLSHSGEYDGEKSIDYLEDALEKFAVLMNSFSADSELEHYFNLLLKSYERYIDLLVMEKRYEEALEISEKLKARHLRKLITRRNMDPESLLSEKYRKELVKLQGSRDMLLRKYMTTDMSGINFDKEEHERLLAKINNIDSRIKKTRIDAEKSSAGYSLVTQNPAGIREAGKNLGEGEALAVFHLKGNNTAYRWLITCSGFSFKQVILAGSVQGMVREIRHGIGIGVYSKRALDNSHFLYNALFKDLVEDKESSIKHLVIIPQSNMALVPFDALVTGFSSGGKPSYLIEKDIMISISPSVTVFVMKRNTGEEVEYSKDFLGFADPFYAGTAGQLPNTVTETRKAASFFNKSSVYIYDDAWESRFKSKNTSQYKYVHLSTHGSIDDWRKEPYVLFASGVDPYSDGLLFASEVYPLYIPARLVTIAACMTGLGKADEYEGVVGFTHAFFAAETREIVLTLWAVDTYSCELLFVDLYRNIASGMEPAAALHAAKKKVLKKYGHPYHWAPYIHYM